MTKVDFLNTASDLRRVAYWVATKQKSRLVKLLWKETQQKPEVKEYLNIDFNQKNIYLAEELLMASQRLQKINWKEVAP